jgi:amidase
MAHHTLERDAYTPDFSPSHEPAVRVAAGDVITVATDDTAYAQMEEFRDLGQVTATINPITGPVYVENAEPGDVLAVTIDDIELGTYGWSISLPGVGALSDVMGEAMMVRRIPINAGIVQLTADRACPARPMVGCIGVAPATGTASTIMPSYVTGGNMDLTDARPGATVYFPVQVPGALLSIGDVHAAMARHEASFVAIEAAARVTVTVEVVKGASLRAPRVHTGEELVFVGLGNPVQLAVRRGYEDMFRHLTERAGLAADDAYVVMSALAHTELGGPTGSADPIHPFTPQGAVTLARIDLAALGLPGLPAL